MASLLLQLLVLSAVGGMEHERTGDQRGVVQ
jgi:hypothetical protein